MGHYDRDNALAHGLAVSLGFAGYAAWVGQALPRVDEKQPPHRPGGGSAGPVGWKTLFVVVAYQIEDL